MRMDDQWTIKLQNGYQEKGSAIEDSRKPGGVMIGNLQVQAGISQRKTGLIGDRRERPWSCSGHTIVL